MTEADAILREEPWPPADGRPGLTQGRYGARGNLEIVSCAVDSGMWVGWFNNDPTDERSSGAAIDRWSGALRFGHGRRYVTCAITQVASGPDFLEVVGLTSAGDLRRHVWSPDHGFVDHGALASGVLAHSRPVEDRTGSLVVAIVDADGASVLTAQPRKRDYPEVHFRRSHLGWAAAVDVDAVSHDDHVDLLLVQPDHQLTLVCGDRAATVATEATSARLQPGLALVTTPASRVELHDLATGTALDLGPGDAGDLTLSEVAGRRRWEAVIRAGRTLRHTRGSVMPFAEEESHPLIAAVWCPPSTVTVHRHARF